MSKNKPAAGDIWEEDLCDGRYARIRIISVDRECDDEVFFVDDGFYTSRMSLEFLKKNFAYIGKAQTRLYDLFEVKEKTDKDDNKLKALLKDCVPFISSWGVSATVRYGKKKILVGDLLTKIKEVLNEK